MSDIVERLSLDAEPSEGDMETAAQEIEKLRAALQTARRDAREEAAREIDCAMRELFGDADEYKQGWNAGLEAGAAAIRALGEEK